MTGKMAKKRQGARQLTVVVNVLPAPLKCALRHENGKHWAGGRLGWVKCDNH